MLLLLLLRLGTGLSLWLVQLLLRLRWLHRLHLLVPGRRRTGPWAALWQLLLYYIGKPYWRAIRCARSRRDGLARERHLRMLHVRVPRRRRSGPRLLHIRQPHWRSRGRYRSRRQ